MMSFLVAISPILLRIAGEAGAPALIQWITGRLAQAKVDAETLRQWKIIAEYYMKKNNVAQEVRDRVRDQLIRLRSSNDA